jgi:heterodisulfide reductase subunit C
MDLVPRQMWRKLLFGFDEEVLSSRTFQLCSSCYTCTLRCPRGLPLTDAVQALKRYAAAQKPDKTSFYNVFTQNMRTWGRVQEGPLMFSYVMGRFTPSLAVSYLPIGVKLMRRGKMHPPSAAHKGRLDKLFAKVAEMEARP